MIVRTGRRIPGVVGPVSGVHHPISVVRMAVEDAYGAKQWREGDEGADDEAGVPDREGHALDLPRGRRVRVPHRRAHGRRDARLRRPEVDGLPRLRGHAQGGARRRRRAPPRRPLRAGADRRDLRGPADGRDRDAAGHPGAEPRRRLPVATSCCRCSARSPAPSRSCSSFDDDYGVEVAMAEAPHGTAPSLMGKDLANPMAMLLACGALLRYAAGRASRAPSGPRARSTRACWRRPPAA